MSNINTSIINTNTDINIIHPLSNKTYNNDEIKAVIDVLFSDKLTMGQNVFKFENEFAKFINSKFAIMVNSGSSANLLAMSVLTNFKYKNKLKPGDKIIIPSICWSTSVWPLIQMNLVPIFVDININTLNINIDKVEEILKNDKDIRGIMAVHILGNSTNMNKLIELKKKYNLILIEDTCESLGSKYNSQYLGTFGECGTFSFYYSHHITTIEGGMIVTDDEDIYELLKCLRSHGWNREQKYKSNYEDIDNRFCFINMGYNLRPTEIQGAMGLVQLKKLNNFNNIRIINYEKIINRIKNYKDSFLLTFEEEENCVSAWFQIPFLINNNINRKEYLEYLNKRGIETRPIVTGNFIRQPVFKNLDINIDNITFENSDIIHDKGFYIGLPCYELSDEKINTLVNILLKI